MRESLILEGRADHCLLDALVKVATVFHRSQIQIVIGNSLADGSS